LVWKGKYEWSLNRETTEHGAERQDGSLGPSLKPAGLKGKAYMALKQRDS